MRIIILNTSGNLGKSTIAREVFLSNLDDANLFEIEPQNSSHTRFNVGINTIDNVKKLSIQILKNENMILDLGNTEVFNALEDLSELGFLDRFDKFVVPFVPNKKEWEDTSRTIQTLMFDYSIQKEKIYMIMSRFDEKKDFSKYKKYEESAEKLGVNFDIRKSIPTSDIITLASDMDCSIKDFIQDIDYEDLIIKTEDEQEQERLFDLMMAQNPIKEFIKKLEDIKNYVVG